MQSLEVATSTPKLYNRACPKTADELCVLHIWADLLYWVGFGSFNSARRNCNFPNSTVVFVLMQTHVFDIGRNGGVWMHMVHIKQHIYIYIHLYTYMFIYVIYIYIYIHQYIYAMPMNTYGCIRMHSDAYDCIFSNMFCMMVIIVQ